jgi:hypothetical protein
MKSCLAESVALDLALDREASEEADTVKESSAARICQLVAVTKSSCMMLPRLIFPNWRIV